MYPLQVYEDIIFRNTSHITTIELSIRFLYYTLPGRFRDAKFASQTIYSALNLIRLYHNSILQRAVDQAKQQHPIANDTEEPPFNIYKRYWTNKSDTFRMISIILSVIDYTQVWMEMEILRKGLRKTYYYIAALEVIKSALNITIFRLTNNRMLLYPNHMERHTSPSKLALQQSQQPQLNHWTGKRTGKDVPLMMTMINNDNEQQQQQHYRKGNGNHVINNDTDVNDYLMSKVLTAEQLRQPQQMVHVMSFLGSGGEVISMIRPTSYVFAVLVWGRRSWKPWYLSLVMDLLSNCIIRWNGSSVCGGQGRMLPLEKNEYRRRVKLLALYIMKGAFYTHVTRPKLERLCDNLENTLLPSMLLVVCRQYLALWENIYFYSSNS